jgi:hypothetical protein
MAVFERFWLLTLVFIALNAMYLIVLYFFLVETSSAWAGGAQRLKL